MIDFSIRPAIESDIPFILNGHQYINRDAPMGTLAQLTKQRIQQEVLSEHPWAFIDVAVYDQEVMAFVYYSLVCFATTGLNVWISNLYVDPFAPRPGMSSVGKRLIDNISVRHPEVKGMYAVTEQNNMAMRTLTGRYGGKIYENFLFIGGRAAS